MSGALAPPQTTQRYFSILTIIWNIRTRRALSVFNALRRNIMLSQHRVWIEWLSRKLHPRMIGMITVLIIAVFGCMTIYWGVSAPSSLDVRYRFLQIAFRTGAIGLMVIALGVALAAIILKSQKERPRTISLRFPDGTSVDLNGVEHMRDNLGQILNALARKVGSGPTVVYLNDNPASSVDESVTSPGGKSLVEL
jgi:hypothetical protein